MEKHSFGPKFVLPTVPENLLSAFIPTQAVFSKRVMFPNPNWSEPDLAVSSQDGFTYILDIYDDNDNLTSVARKIETVIVNAAGRSIVGVGLIAKNAGSAFTGKATDLERLRGTFHKLFGEPTKDWGIDDCRTYLEPLFRMEAFRTHHENIRWDHVLDMAVGPKGWEAQLREHIKGALDSKLLLASAPPG